MGLTPLPKFESLPAYHDFLRSLEELDFSNPSMSQWSSEFYYPLGDGDQTLKNVADKIAHEIHDLTGFKWTCIHISLFHK